MRLSQRAKILNLLLTKKDEYVSMRELNRIAYRYGARIDELRRAGYKIETIQAGAGNFFYRINCEGRQ